MPSLDVNVVLTDPDLADGFSVRRNAETLDDYGRTVKTPTVIAGQMGIVTWDTGETVRREDGQLSPASIEIVTPFSLRDESRGFQPDVVLWRGGEYLVIKSEPYRHFGGGFTKARAVSTIAQDAPAED